MKFRSIRLGICLSILGLAPGAETARASATLASELTPAPRARIQWLHGEGHVIDVNWSSESRWIWKSSPEGRLVPALQLQVTPPHQIHIVGSDDARVTLVKSAIEGHSSLLLEGGYPAFTAKVYADSGEGAARKAGLVVRFDAQETVVHESCASGGVRVFRRRSRGAAARRDAYYVGMFCERTRDGVTVHLRGSENVILEGAAAEGPLPLSRIARRARFGVARADGEGELARFTIVLSATAAAEAAPAPKTRPVSAATDVPVAVSSASAPDSPERSGLRLSVALLPTHLSYDSGIESDGVDPSEYGVALDARAVLGADSQSGTRWEAEAHLPVFALVGRPVGFPAGGAYLLAVRAAPETWSWGRDRSFQLTAGASLQYLSLSRRQESSGLRVGPELGFSMAGKSAFFSDGLAHSSRLWLSPLAGGFAMGGESAFELLRSGGRRRLDFELALKYFSDRGGDGEGLPALAVSTGFRFWL